MPVKRKVRPITRIALVIDRSGSMSSIVSAARGGLTEQINTIKLNADKGGTTFVSLVSFDDEIVTHFDAVNVKKLPKVDPEKIIAPRGMTAMNDAIKKAIDLLSAQPDTEGTANLVIVISDGEENASKIPSNELSSAIKKLEETGKWTFTFMLSNVDIHAVSSKLGINMNNIQTFAYSSAGTTQAFASMSDSTTRYLNMREMGVTAVDDFYSKKD